MPARLSNSESGEEAPFLPSEKITFNNRSDVTNGLRLHRNSLWTMLYIHPFIFILHFCILIVNVIWLITNVRYQSHNGFTKGSMYEPPGAPYSERYERYNLPLGVKSPYTTFDRSIADEAWAKISMKDGLGWLEVPQDQVDRMEQSSVRFEDGGYFFGMDVFHQLHCLNYLRKKSVLYNHLYPSDGEDEQVPPEFHIPHCIDSIRLSLQCHADVSLIPQRWVDGWLEPWAMWTNKHTCRNFDSIRDWAAASVPKLAGRLHHPELGTVVSGKLNLSALPIWREAHDPDVVIGNMPVCLTHGDTQ